MDESTKATSNVLNPIQSVCAMPCHFYTFHYIYIFLSLSLVELDFVIGFTAKTEKLSPLSAQVTRESLNAEPQPCGTAWIADMFSDHSKQDLPWCGIGFLSEVMICPQCCITEFLMDNFEQNQNRTWHQQTPVSRMARTRQLTSSR